MPEPLFDPNKKQLKKSAEQSAPEAAKDTPAHPLADLQQKVGNRAVQRLIQRSSTADTAVDDETADRINANRGGGQRLDSGVQSKMSDSIGYDFNDVRVHTSAESDTLNKSLGAKAFTTGSDIFFSDGAYDPGSSSGQELIAHELTHVVQQGTGAAGGTGSGMTVNDPGDQHEQEADSVARSVTAASQAPVQMQEEEEELAVQTKREDGLQRQEEEEELAVQARHEERIQMQDIPEDELQMQEVPEEELQMQEVPEEELQMQEDEEEEYVQEQPLEEEEEELMP